jgi:hypothetical protein
MNCLERIFSQFELEELEKNMFMFSSPIESWNTVMEREVIVFGAGLFGQTTIDTLLYEKIRPKCIVDTDASKHGLLYKNIRVYSVEKLKSFRYPLVILTSAYAKEMYNICKRYNVETIIPVDLPKTLTLIWPIGYRIKDYIYNDEFAKFLALLNTQSMFVIKNFLCFQFTLDLEYIKKIYTPYPYFASDMLDLMNYSVFCDLGASIGDTYVEYKKKAPSYKDRRNFYYGFEPDLASFQKLKATAGGDMYVKLFNCAVGSGDTVMKLAGGGGCRQAYFSKE